MEGGLLVADDPSLTLATEWKSICWSRHTLVSHKHRHMSLADMAVFQKSSGMDLTPSSSFPVSISDKRVDELC